MATSIYQASAPNPPIKSRPFDREYPKSVAPSITDLILLCILVFTAGDRSQCNLTHTNNCDSKPILSDIGTVPTLAYDSVVIRKPMTAANLRHRLSFNKSSASFESDDESQLANLCWHTHGSIFWQNNVMNDSDQLDSI